MVAPRTWHASVAGADTLLFAIDRRSGQQLSMVWFLVELSAECLSVVNHELCAVYERCIGSASSLYEHALLTVSVRICGRSELAANIPLLSTVDRLVIGSTHNMLELPVLVILQTRL